MLFFSIVALGLTATQLAAGASADKIAGRADIKRQVQARYKEVYGNEIQKHNIRSAQQAALINTASIKQDKVLSNVTIEMRQEKQEALVEVNAATAGVEGSSVESSIYNTERNEAFELNNKNSSADANMKQMIASIGSYQASILEVKETEIDYSRQPTIYNSLARLDASDIANVESVAADIWG